MAERLDTTSHSGEMLKLPSSIYEANFLSRKKIIHRGMEMVRNSLLARRSCNRAIIFVYGLSGAGKTTSLNHLFGFELIEIVNRFQADTKVVTEYVATMESEAWRVNNLQIGFIDMPGWGDGDTSGSDIRNMAIIETFISKHPHLGPTSKLYKCYPNIVIIAIKATDTRLKGENAQVVRMFRALTKLNIIDKERPNVLIILTNIDHIGKKTFKERLIEVKTVVYDLAICYLQAEPVIVYVENHYDDLELEVKGDWTVLRDGTLQPRNVFENMISMMSRCKDEVGQEAVRIYFASRGNNKPVKMQCESSEPKEYQIKKWSMIIAQEFSTHLSEVNQALQNYVHSNPVSYSVNSLVLLMVELEDHSLTQLSVIQPMSLNEVEILLLPYKMSNFESQALVEACGVKPLKPSDLSRHVGYGLNAETGEVTNHSVFDIECGWYVKNGMKLPKFMDAVVSRDKRRIEWKRLNQDFSLTEEINELTSSTERSKVISKYQFQIFLYTYTIKITLEEQELLSHLNPAFKHIVANLPATSIEEGNHVSKEYTDLLKMYGEWITPACGFGGIVQGEMEIDETEFKDSQVFLNTCIDNLLDKLESSDDIQIQQDTINQESTIFDKLEKSVVLDWKGGKPCKSNLSLNILTPKLWDEWKISLNEFSIPLTKDSNRPIHLYVSLVNTDIATQVKLAYPTAYRDRLSEFQDSSQRSSGIHEPFTVGSAAGRESLAMQYISSTLSKANGGFPESATVIRGTKDEFQTKYISEIQLGDTVLCRNPWELKYREVSKINCTDEGKDLEYLFFKHEHGELLIGYEHTILKVLFFPVYRFRMVFAKDIRLGDHLVFIDKENNRELTSKVTERGTKSGKGHYSLNIKDGFSDIAVNQVLTGDEEAACFPGNATVLLKGGKRVRMGELKVGDFVLSIHPITSKPIYSKVYIWGHRDPHATATFLHITHPYGHLHISADHLILSGDEKKPIPAYQLRAGDVIYFTSLVTSQHILVSDANRSVGDSYSLVPVPVLYIHTCMHVGYYAPFTNNGLIVVDNIATSVYSQLSTHSRSNNNSWVRDNITNQLVLQFGMHVVSQRVLTPVRMVCKLGIDSVVNEPMNRKSNIHKYCQWLLDNF